MPRDIRTRRPASNIAHQAKTQPILAFNHEGKIDLYLFDNTDEEVARLGLDKSQQIPLPLLAGANILFSIARKLRLSPGETLSHDEEILKTLKARISDNIINKDDVVAEIIDCWNKVVNHPLSKNYENLKGSNEPTRLGFHGAYKPMIHDYIAKYLATLTRYDSIQTWLFLQANEIIRSTLKRRPFSTNPYIKMDNLIATTEECKKDIPDSTQVIDAIKIRLEREQGRWFASMIGLIGFEIETIFEEESLKAKYPQLKLAFKKILAGEYNRVSHDAEIMRHLELILKSLKNPDNGAPAIQVRQAIESIILKKLKEYDFKLDEPAKFSLAEMAGSSSEEEEKLLIKLLNPAETFTPALLTSIQRRSKNELMQDVVAERQSKMPRVH